MVLMQVELINIVLMVLTIRIHIQMIVIMVDCDDV